MKGQTTMLATVTVEEAQAKLPELIAQLSPGEEVIITENQQPVAKLVATGKPAERPLGTLRGTVLYMAADFDAPLGDFTEYME
jgi:antitoxin (DNA-binding transcriptional repressor) of toxin-antitoxin stability system